MENQHRQHYDIGVVGLGYVGLTLATVLAEVGFSVLGVERRDDVVDLTQRGVPHFSETGMADALRRVTSHGALVAATGFEAASRCDTYIITVGTPLDNSGAARLDMIEAATRQVAENMPDDALVILRSTVKIGTARDVVAPILTASGKRFHLAMCPERTLEGRALQELRELPQIVGADDEETRVRAAAIFGRLTNTVVQVSRLEAAEMIKLVDNTFRDVQFAFANEVARACEAVGINANEVIALGKLGYKRTKVPKPGLVGGPCLEKDPHILIQSVAGHGIDLEITRAARLVNERQPVETAKFIVAEMERRGLSANSKVAVLGLAFKGVPATDDLRGSMSLKVIEALREAAPHLDIALYDPVAAVEELEHNIPGAKAFASLQQAIAGAGVGIIANNHPALGELPPVALLEQMTADGFIYDYWNHFSNLSVRELGGSYFAVGNTKAA
jgi:UDP-N-acetyl-D-mannosaminuronic acid dehydrogenase